MCTPATPCQPWVFHELWAHYSRAFLHKQAFLEQTRRFELIYMINIYQHYNGLCNHLYITSQQIPQFWSIYHAQILAPLQKVSARIQPIDFHVTPAPQSSAESICLYVSVRWDIFKWFLYNFVRQSDWCHTPILAGYPARLFIGKPPCWQLVTTCSYHGFHGDSTGPWRPWWITERRQLWQIPLGRNEAFPDRLLTLPESMGQWGWYHLVMTNITMERSTMLLIGKASISMGHFPWLC